MFIRKCMCMYKRKRNRDKVTKASCTGRVYEWINECIKNQRWKNAFSMKRIYIEKLIFNTTWHSWIFINKCKEFHCRYTNIQRCNVTDFWKRASLLLEEKRHKFRRKIFQFEKLVLGLFYFKVVLEFLFVCLYISINEYSLLTIHKQMWNEPERKSNDDAQAAQ